MEFREVRSIIIALIVLTLIASFSSLIKGNYSALLTGFIFSFVILLLTIVAKKGTAYLLDSDVEHELWHVHRFGFKPSAHFSKPMPFGGILPLILNIITLGYLKLPALLTYETRALKHRAAKRFGIFSYTEMTDWHNALIGSSGIIVCFIIAGMAYLTNFGELAKLATFYAFANMLPISKLDGIQIFFGSKVLYAVLTAITLIFLGYAFFLV